MWLDSWDFYSKIVQWCKADEVKLVARQNGIVSYRKSLLVIAAVGTLAVASNAKAQQYYFTTLAGLPGSDGYADGTNGTARFSNPAGLVVAPSGDVYVADEFNNTIRKCTADGIVSTIAGAVGHGGEQQDGTGADARFSYPVGIAMDTNGDLIVCDATTIRKVTTNGVVSTIAGKPQQLSAGNSSDGVGTNAVFHGLILGLAIATNGNIYVADSGDQTIRVITPDGTVTTIAGSHGVIGSENGTNTDAHFFFPGFLTLENTGNLLVSDLNNEVIRRVTPSGAVTTVAGSPTWYDGSPHWHGSTIDGTGPAAQFISPGGLVFDNAGDLIIGDYATIRKMTPQAAVTTFAGLPDVQGSAVGLNAYARFNQVGGIALDTSGNILFADSGNNTIRKGIRIQPCSIQSVIVSNGLAALNFTAATNSNYVVECVDDLASGSVWNTLGTVAVTNSPQSFTDPTAASASARYYRLRQIFP